MSILTDCPVHTGRNINALATSFPVECAMALQQQPEAALGVKPAAQIAMAEDGAACAYVDEMLEENAWAKPALRHYQARVRAIRVTQPVPRAYGTAAQVLVMAELMGSIFDEQFANA